MKKKMLVLLVVLLLVVSTIQVAFAAPDPPKGPPGLVEPSCHMGASWWEPGTGPGNANGVKPGERGMYHVHNKDQAYGTPPHGATHMDIICH